MSTPSIPGFTEPPLTATLADLWERPSQPFPDPLWPIKELRRITRDPTGWLRVVEHFFTEEMHGGRGCVLVPSDGAGDALTETTWIGRDLGQVGIWRDGGFDNGLEGTDGDLQVEFFAHVRRPSGASLPVVELSLPFLWYFDAFPITDGWAYLNRSGREQELARYSRTDEAWHVEVRALEFRQFLYAYGKIAVLQVDYVPKLDDTEFERVDAEFRSDWAHLDFYALNDRAIGGRPAFSRVMGQYLVDGLKNARAPRFEERREDRHYPSFIYGLDAATGQPLTHTCDPDELGTYFDKDGTRLHYLTPIYFKREVLQPYSAEPNRYRLSTSRLSCLDLWGVDISINTAGLVELYLGDLGRDLPSDEWGHWQTYNVPPEGQMDEGRFRKDFLNQVAGSPDIVRDLRRARDAANSAAERLFGAPIWRPLTGAVNAEFESLIGPLNDDPAAHGPCLLILTKALVDAVDPAPLKSYLESHQKGEQSLRLLQRFTQQLGDADDVTVILRDLQGFRSRGGVAHLAGSDRAKAEAAVGITGLSNAAAFESVVLRLTACLNAVGKMVNGAATP